MDRSWDSPTQIPIDPEETIFDDDGGGFLPTVEASNTSSTHRCRQHMHCAAPGGGNTNETSVSAPVLFEIAAAVMALPHSGSFS